MAKNKFFADAKYHDAALAILDMCGGAGEDIEDTLQDAVVPYCEGTGLNPEVLYDYVLKISQDMCG